MATNNGINQAQVVFSVYLSEDTEAVTGDSTIYTTLFDSEIVNQENCYSSATGIFSVPISGNYVIGYTIGYLAESGGGLVFYTSINYNGSMYAYSTWPTKNQLGGFYGTNGWVMANAEILIPMIKGKEAKVVVYGEGGAKNDKIAGATAIYKPSTFYACIVN